MRQPRPFRLGYGALPDSYPSERPFSGALDFLGPNGERGLIEFDGSEWIVSIDGLQVGTIPGGGGGGGGPFITGVAPDANRFDSYLWQPTLNNGGSTNLWEVTDGVLPDGLSIDQDTGEVSGTATEAGPFNFEIAASIRAGTNAGATAFSRQWVNIISTGLLPTDVSGCTLWLDFTDPTTMWTNTAATTPVAADNDIIVRMDNKANTGVLFYNASGSPRYKPAIVGGASVGQFATATVLQRLTGGSGQIGDFITASAFTYIIVVEVQSVSTTGTDYFNAYPIMGDNGGYSQLYFSTASSGQHFLYNWDGNADYARVTGLSQSTYYVVSAQKTGSNIRIRANRGSWSTTASGNTQVVTQPLTVGQSTSIAGQTRLAHAVIYNTAISDSDLEEVEDYLANTVGIVL